MRNLAFRCSDAKIQIHTQRCGVKFSDQEAWVETRLPFLRLPHGAYDFLLAPEGRFLQGRLLLHPQEQYFRLWEVAAALV